VSNPIVSQAEMSLREAPAERRMKDVFLPVSNAFGFDRIMPISVFFCEI
jgi:hypothetical protein